MFLICYFMVNAGFFLDNTMIKWLRFSNMVSGPVTNCIVCKIFWFEKQIQLRKCICLGSVELQLWSWCKSIICSSCRIVHNCCSVPKYSVKCTGKWNKPECYFLFIWERNQFIRCQKWNWTNFKIQQITISTSSTYRKVPQVWIDNPAEKTTFG